MSSIVNVRLTSNDLNLILTGLIMYVDSSARSGHGAISSKAQALYDSLHDVKPLFSHYKNSNVVKSIIETSCPCPPETAPLGVVDGGILARLELLNETVPVNGSVVPLNLE